MKTTWLLSQKFDLRILMVLHLETLSSYLNVDSTQATGFTEVQTEESWLYESRFDE